MGVWTWFAALQPLLGDQDLRVEHFPLVCISLQDILPTTSACLPGVRVSLETLSYLTKGAEPLRSCLDLVLWAPGRALHTYS